MRQYGTCCNAVSADQWIETPQSISLLIGAVCGAAWLYLLYHKYRFVRLPGDRAVFHTGVNYLALLA